MALDKDNNGQVDTERRVAQRVRVLKDAEISFGNTILACTVLDISETGARIGFNQTVSIPDEVILRLPDSSRYLARRKWVRGSVYGFHFIHKPATGSDDTDR